MQVRELSIPDSYEVTPVLHGDDRGVFFEWYRHDVLEETIGHSLDLRQANTSVSRRGVVRGTHFADVPPGQAKYVTVTRGAILDFVVDVRVGSPTFGEWDSVLLDAVDCHALYLAEGLGHTFLSMTDDTTVSYLVSDTYNPAREHGIDPLDPTVGLAFPIPIEELIISPKDREAPSLVDALEAGALPSFASSRSHYAALDETGR
ncbi:MAG: dTDP-4-dehydrorhamnose 3,5-epimerase family protein [Galbitalea sp.]